MSPTQCLGSEDQLSRIQDAVERTTRRLELEKRKLHDLSEASRKAQAEYDDKRTRYSFNKADVQLEFRRAEEHLKLLENRVAQATSKLNIANAGMVDIRKCIDKNRKDRISLMQVYRHLKREASERQEELNAIKESLDAMQEYEQQVISRKEHLWKIREAERADFRKMCSEKEQTLKEQVSAEVLLL